MNLLDLEKGIWFVSVLVHFITQNNAMHFTYINIFLDVEHKVDINKISGGSNAATISGVVVNNDDLATLKLNMTDSSRFTRDISYSIVCIRLGDIK